MAWSPAKNMLVSFLPFPFLEIEKALELRSMQKKQYNKFKLLNADQWAKQEE